MSEAIYNVQRNASGKLILMMSGGRKKYPFLPPANTEITATVKGEPWVLVCAKIAINKGWDPMQAATPGKDNHLPELLAEWFRLPLVDKTGASNDARKGCKVALRKHGRTWALQPIPRR